MKRPEMIIRLYMLFVVSAFIGWVYEIIATYLIYGGYYDRGVLHLPMCPIYGFGMLLLYGCLRKVKNSFLIVTFSAIITTALELSASYFIEYKYHYILWTYEGWPCNFQNRISLISSIIFGLMALLVFKIVKPALDKTYTNHRVCMNLIIAVVTLIAVILQIMGMQETTNWKI